MNPFLTSLREKLRPHVTKPRPSAKTHEGFRYQLLGGWERLLFSNNDMLLKPNVRDTIVVTGPFGGLFTYRIVLVEPTVLGWIAVGKIV